MNERQKNSFTKAIRENDLFSWMLHNGADMSVEDMISVISCFGERLWQLTHLKPGGQAILDSVADGMESYIGEEGMSSIELAYKLFRVRDGKLYPLYVYADEEVPVGTWVMAKPGPRTADGHVKAKLGPLSFRPGWHLCEAPLADHIGKRQGGKLVQAKDSVWCLVAYNASRNYTPDLQRKTSVRRDQCMREVPENGYYWYSTNPSAKVRWLIADRIKVIRTLSDEEVSEACAAHHLVPQEKEK